MQQAIQLLVWVALFGFVAWFIQRLVPMTAQIKIIFNVFAAVLVLLFVLNSLGLFRELPNP